MEAGRLGNSEWGVGIWDWGLGTGLGQNGWRGEDVDGAAAVVAEERRLGQRDGAEGAVREQPESAALAEASRHTVLGLAVRTSHGYVVAPMRGSKPAAACNVVAGIIANGSAPVKRTFSRPRTRAPTLPRPRSGEILSTSRSKRTSKANA